jgi:hypothetical protein
MANELKTEWSGELVAVQPRIRLMRSFDERQHSYLGYVLSIQGMCGSEAGEFTLAVGKGAHAKFQFQAGVQLSGAALRVPDSRLEVAAFYKVSRLKVEDVGDLEPAAPPPFLGVPPDLPTYRARGHRRLAVVTYETKCTRCIWGCKMPVEIVVDHWNPSVRRYRFETFCYGPKSCPFHSAGPTRKVPGRKGMSWEEEDWVDEDATSHRGPDE